jgi:hypothetical protein
MPITNIKSLSYSDHQDLIIDKINNNFDELVELHGGSQGISGPTGDSGEIGDMGGLGPAGSTGSRGTRWFVQTINPTGIGNYIMEGDFWVNSNDGVINVFNENGWEPTGYSISSAENVFYSVESIWSGGTGTSILLDQSVPEDYVFILADKVSDSGILNQPLSKFMISTDSLLNDSPLLEFSKSNLEDGSLNDYSQHPVFKWKSSNPNNNSVVFQIPGGSFILGASGGFSSSFQSMNVNASTEFSIEYSGAATGSGIFSTGGFFLNSPSGSFTLESNFFSITGGSGSISSPVVLNPQLPFGAPSIYSLSDNSFASLYSTRNGDSFNTLSHSTYHLSLESNAGIEFSIDTKGKITTKKIENGITYTSSPPTATSTVSGSFVSWYLISVSGTKVLSFPLESGNTIVLTPSVTTGSFIGIGLFTDPVFSWGGTGGLKNGESIDISLLFSPNTSIRGVSDGIKFIGKGTNSADVSSVVTLPFLATNIDFTISKGGISGATSVFYRAYGPTGGYGGSFNL